MCTVIVLHRPKHAWPLLLAANRDEMAGRPWRPPARHWRDRENVVAGLDELAGGTWMGLNDEGVVACVLNRVGTLGPAPGKRSRGELPLEALDHADADQAVAALADLDPRAWRPFNMVVADDRDAFWLRSTGVDAVRVARIPEGLSMLTARDLNDPADPRIAAHRPGFAAAPAPDPGTGDFSAWRALLAAPAPDGRRDGEAALCIARGDGFGTRSSSIVALPSTARAGVRPVWLFAPGPPDRAAWEAVPLP